MTLQTKVRRPRLIWLSLLLRSLLLLSLSPVAANAKAHHLGTLSSINVGARYSSLLTNRGVVLYRDFQVDPIFSVFLFDDRVEFLGDSLGYRDFVFSDLLRLRTKVSSITDKPLFPAHSSVRANSPQRTDTYEWSGRLEWFLPGYNKNYRSEIDFGYAKDISAHQGNYFDLQIKTKIFDFEIPQVGTLVEPNAYVSVGYGDSAHNRYFYGPTAADAGLNNLSYGLWFAFPDEADRFFPIVLLTHFEVIGEKNKAAEYAQGRDSGWLFSFIAAAGILE